MPQEEEQKLYELLIFPRVPEILQNHPSSDFNRLHEEAKTVFTTWVKDAEERPAGGYRQWKKGTQSTRKELHDGVLTMTIEDNINKANLESDEECTRYLSLLHLTNTQALTICDIIDSGRQASDVTRNSHLNTDSRERKKYVDSFLGIISNINHCNDEYYSIWAKAIRLEPTAEKKYKTDVRDAISRLDLTSDSWKDKLTSMFSVASFGNDDGAKTIRNTFIEERAHGAVAGIKGTPTADLIAHMSALLKMRSGLTKKFNKFDQYTKDSIRPMLAETADKGLKRSQDDVDADADPESAGPSGKRPKHST